MSGAVSSSTTTTTTRTVTRTWRRVTPPAWPFVWRGLVPLLLLLAALGYGLTRFARQGIEAQVAQQTRAALLAAGLGWATVAVDGQAVTVSGEPPTEAAGAAALSTAAAATCPTWLGDLVCATSVTAAFTRPAAPPPVARWPAVKATLEGGVLTVRGAVPTAEDRGRLEAQAHALKQPPRVTEVRIELAPSGVPGPQGWEALAARAVAVAGRCQEGWAALGSGGAFSAACTVARDELAALEKEARAPAEPGTLGPISFLVHEQVAACEQGFRALLEGARIEFATGSAELLPVSRPLLLKVAAVAKGCPGSLRIEGHTDAVGQPAANGRLSAARAATVREALVALGLPADRLVAEGFGPNRPVASNDSADGRARNRRIEFHVVRSQGDPP